MALPFVPDKILGDPHLQDRGFFVEVEDPELGVSQQELAVLAESGVV